MLRVLLLLLSLSGCATVDVYGVVGRERDLYTGTATGYLSRTGTITLANETGNRCDGGFAYGEGLRGEAMLSCSDGQSALVRFTGLTPMSGFGGGRSDDGRPVRFTYGLSRSEAVRYLGF